MSEIDRLVFTIKRQLKFQGITYRQLATKLGLSEPSVKRMFSTRHFTLERLVEISELLGFSLAELTEEAAGVGTRLEMLNEQQERDLVADERLLLVSVCVLNHWTLDDITRVYAMTTAEVIGKLVKLDRLRFIRLLPGNRVRLNVARDFDWLPKGPISHYFLRNGLGDFLNSPFTAIDEVFAFSTGMLTDTACTKMQAELRKLRQRFAELHEESLASPLAKRRGTGLLLAMREWEIAAFSSLRR